jgi:hypothetical protein
MNKLSPLAAVVAALVATALATAARAQPILCSSDGQPQPTALLERFINADCETCWADRQTPEPASGTLAIDWVAPGTRGDDAPLSVVATRDASDRLEVLGKKLPAQSATAFAQRTPDARKLRVAHGLPLNDYIGTSIELKPGSGGPWKAWLLLVETLPAGTEGSAVERNLVRNAFQADWPAKARGAAPWSELRPMRIAEGAKAERLRVVGWVEDERGRIRAIAQSRCARK